MKRFLYLFLSGIALLTACQNNPSKQTDKDIQNIDSIKQETKADSIKQTANIDSIKQVLAKTTDPLKRIQLHQQVIDLTIEAATPEERCRIFDDFNTQVEKELLKINEHESYFLDHYYEFRMDDEGNEKEPHDSIIQKEQYYKKYGIDVEDLGEGIVELALPAKFYTKYVKLLPKYYQDFWHLLKDSENIAPDAGLIITWRELGNLLARYEAYVKANPTQKELFCRLQDDYKFLQYAFLFGLDNTPISYDDVHLDNDVKKEWERYIKTYPKSPTTPFAKEILQQKKFDDLEHMYNKLTKFQETSNYPLLKACPAKK